MTIQRRPRPQRRRQLAALLLSGAVLYLVAATAASPTAKSALETLTQQGNFALNLLRTQLGDLPFDSSLPTSLTLAIGQSPILLSSQEAVLQLRSTEETDDSTSVPSEDVSEPPVPDVPIPEKPAEPDPPLLFADNGVTAKTLVPTSPDGYLVAGNVYISNRTDHSIDAASFDGTFSASLPQEAGPQVLIVHTHGSEAYTMPPGQEYIPSGDSRTTDCAYNVVRVGDELARTLEAAGLSVLHDSTLHDYPEYSGAYGRSLSTVEEYLRQYPTITFVLDVHRDAISDGDGSPYKVVSGVAGANAAQMSFVIGTDGGGLEHPYWLENLKLAASIQQHLLDSYPTLMRPITVRNSRYNQHVTTGSLLIEMGAAGNSLDEALFSARLLGQAMAEVILSNENIPENTGK